MAAHIYRPEMNEGSPTLLPLVQQWRSHDVYVRTIKTDGVINQLAIVRVLRRQPADQELLLRGMDVRHRVSVLYNGYFRI